MARYPGDEIVSLTKTIDGRHCQRIDLTQLGVLIDPNLARRAFRAAGVWYKQINPDAYWVENLYCAHLALNVAVDPWGTLSSIEHLEADLPEMSEEVAMLRDLYQKIHGRG